MVHRCSANAESLSRTSLPGFDFCEGRGFNLSPMIEIRRDGGTEPQSLVSVPKYTRVKFKITLQRVSSEGICSVESDSFIGRGR